MHNNKVRDSRFELLRIISMLLIVAYHFFIKGGMRDACSDVKINEIWMNLLLPAGKMSVNAFILISGYFLSEKSSVNLKKSIKILAQICFYILFAFILFLILSASGISKINNFPFIALYYWFPIAYFIMFLISPYLNLIIDNIPLRQHFAVIVFSFAVLSVLPTFVDYNLLDFMSDIVWFVFLYFVAAFISKSKTAFDLSAWKCGIMSVIFYLLAVPYGPVYGFIHSFLPKYNTVQMHTVFVFFSSLFLFLMFKNINIGNSRIINSVASATFGVYLLHDNNYVKTVLWEEVFHNVNYRDSKVLIPYSIAAIIVVFLVCTLIDLLRIKLVEKPFMKLLNRLEPQLNKLCLVINSFTKKGGEFVLRIFSK